MQPVERPRFRQDLVAEPIEDGGARFIDVADPDSGHMFRFFEVEYSLACAMDGERDVAGIVQWAEEELGLKPSANEVRTVIATLGSLGYLDSGKEAAAAATEPAAAVVAAMQAETPRPAEVAAEAPRPAAAPARKTPPSGVPRKTPPSGTPSVKPSHRSPAMADSDEHLERGVVTGNKRPHTPVPDVELGHAGAHVEERAAELPKSDDMELGAPGAVAAAPAARAGGRGADLELGAPGANVSTDLVADMAISPADVKEAVRASQVMKSVDVPPELAAELEPAQPKQPAKQPEAKQPQPAAKQPEAKQPQPVKQPDAAPAKKPIDMPTERPVVVTKPPAPAGGVSPVLWVMLVVAVLAAGGFALWKFVLSKKSSPTAEVKPTPPPPQPTPPPPPPVETAKLASEQSPPEEIKPTGAAQIATIIATDSDVKEGDTIAKLVGFKPSGDKVAMYEKEIEKFKSDIEVAEKARDAAANDIAKKPHETKILGLNKIIADREAKLVTARTELDKFLIKAPGTGKVTIASKANAKVTPSDVIATLQRAPLLVVTFKTAPDAAVDAKVLLAVKDSDQKLSCTVVATGGDGTKIACPADAAAEGTEVSYAGLDPSAAADAPTDGDAPAGDAPADADGNGDADGSAAGEAADSAAAPAEGTAPKAAPRTPRPRPRAAPAPAPAEKPASDKLFPPGEKPAAPTEKPAAPTEKPAAPTEKPAVAPTENPAAAAGSGS